MVNIFPGYIPHGYFSVISFCSFKQKTFSASVLEANVAASAEADNRNWLLGTAQISSATWNPTNRNNLGWFEQIWISDSQIANNKSQVPLFLPPCWRRKTENFKLQIKKYKFQIKNWEVQITSLVLHFTQRSDKGSVKKGRIRFTALNKMCNYLFCCILPWCDYQSCWADILDLQSCYHIIFLKYYWLEVH